MQKFNVINLLITAENFLEVIEKLNEFLKGHAVGFLGFKEVVPHEAANYKSANEITDYTQLEVRPQYGTCIGRYGSNHALQGLTDRGMLCMIGDSITILENKAIITKPISTSSTSTSNKRVMVVLELTDTEAFKEANKNAPGVLEAEASS